MNPKQFLQIGGIVLILVGILGFIGLIGPTAQDSIFGSAWWFDNAENWAHLLLGIVAVVAAYALQSPEAQKWLVVIVGVVGVLFGLVNLVLPDQAPNFGATNLENPTDTILHFVVGIWALWAALRKPGMAAPKPS